jgi:hypothetical protein
MFSAVRKIATKPVWWWERRLSYPIRSQFDRLPQLAVERGSKRFVVLTTPDTFGDAMWAAWSWYRFLQGRGFELQLVVDGEADQFTGAVRLFPGISVYSAQSLCAYVCEREPRLETFILRYPMGRKLALMLALSHQHPVLYSDHDVLAFHPPAELLSCIERGVSCYFMEDVDGTRDPQVLERARVLGLDYIPSFNSGFLYLPEGSLSMTMAAKLLAGWQPPVKSWFAEQTTLSVMLRGVNAQALPPDRYVISARRQFYWEKDVDYEAIVARHFTGTVRHVMYRYGLPTLLRQSRLWQKEMVNA